MKDTIEMARIAGARDDGNRFEFELRDLEFLVALVRADERKQVALDKKAENARELGLDYEPAPQPDVQQEPVVLLYALEQAREWIGAAPHGDNCFLHGDGEYNRCFCGKDSIENYIDGVLENTTTPPQRTWVGLTDDERGLLVIEHLGPNALLHKPMSIYDAFHMGIDAAEAAHSIKENP